MTPSGKRVLVTGGSGFLASTLIPRLAQLQCETVRITRHPAPVAPELRRAGLQTAVGDLRDRQLWTGLLPGADIVVHLAAQTSGPVSDQDPPADWSANVLPMLTLLEACRETGWRPLILFAGTCTECGIPQGLPVNEDHPDRPLTIYDTHKLAAENYLKHYVRQGWARGATLRLANVYGPGPSSDNTQRGVLNSMMRRALDGQSLPLYGNGELLRDYLFVTDAVDAFVAAAAHPSRVDGRHFVVASGTGHTLAAAFSLVADRAATVTGTRVSITTMPPPAGLSAIEARNFVGDSGRLRDATGWEAQTTLESGIDQTLTGLLEVRSGHA